MDTYEVQKSNWISQYGSNFLKKTLEAGYLSNERYATERVELEYPGFHLVIVENFKETDSPPDFCFAACQSIEGAVCKHQGNNYKTYFIVVDDFLGKYQIAKEIKESEVKSELTKSIIDVEKDIWVSQYGSDLLKEMLDSGYKSNDRYVIERLEIDRPGFELIVDRNIERIDTPPSYCLEACRSIEGSYCGQYRYTSGKYYITLDNYLETYQIAKEIKHPHQKIEVELEIDKLAGLPEKPIDESIEEKNDWIFLNGSDLLQQSTLAGYDVKERYLEERIALEYPGFNDVTGLGYTKTGSPSHQHLKICNKVEDSYCSYYYLTGAYYVTIDNYLGKYIIAKKIPSNPKFSYLVGFGIFSLIGIILFNSLIELKQPQNYEPFLDPILTPIPK